MKGEMQKLKEYIKKQYDSGACAWNESRSEGNSNDVFSDGFTCGESVTLFAIAKMLGLVEELGLEEPEEEENNY